MFRDIIPKELVVPILGHLVQVPHSICSDGNLIGVSDHLDVLRQGILEGVRYTSKLNVLDNLN